jgi:hypothetical protein
MKVRIHHVLGLGLCLSALLVAGCGPKDLPRKTLHQVNGRLVWQGAPVAFVTVHFEPVKEGGVEATGITNEKGEFTLRTYRNDESDGAAPGDYKIVLENYDPVRVGNVPKGQKATILPPRSLKPDITKTIPSEDTDLGEITLP